MPPVDGEGGPRRHLLRGGDSRAFDLGLMSCHVLSLMLLRVPRPLGLRQLHLDLQRSAFLSAWVIIAVLHRGIGPRSHSFSPVTYSSGTPDDIYILKYLFSRAGGVEL